MGFVPVRSLPRLVVRTIVPREHRVKSLLIAAGMLFAAAAASPQSMEDLNLQIHGYATQGFLYTTKNNIFTTHSSDGSAAWTQAVVNIGAQPTPRLHVAIQARYYLLGAYGNKIVIDWAAWTTKSISIWEFALAR